MSKLMWILGILLVAAGAALGLMAIVSAASLEGTGISLDLAAILLVGGIVSLGLGSVISLLDQQRAALLAGGAVMAAPAAPIPEFGRKAAESAAVAAAASAAAHAGEEVSEPTRDTIKALEQARQEIEQAFEPKAPEDGGEAPGTLPPEEPADEAEETGIASADQLYVVEERFIRMRPARILSDGTVEAETEEGWMRFENLEHLDEYLDAIEPAKS